MNHFKAGLADPVAFAYGAPALAETIEIRKQRR